jgi:23S rRNA pseudouridine2605 synthase
MKQQPPGRGTRKATAQQPTPGQRLQLHRALSKLGLGSRTQAWQWIAAGDVRVDGRVVTDPLTWVDLGCQKITCGDRKPRASAAVTVAMHKPRGLITSRSDERGRRTVFDLLPAGLPYLFPVGRLDADSEGLLLFTNDAQLSVRLTEPAHRVPKTYRVTLRGVPSNAALAQIRKGIELADGWTRPARVRILEQQSAGAQVEMVLTEGRNRQIRRMWAALGHKVRRLVRSAVGAYELGDLGLGECRILHRTDLDQLLRSAPGTAAVPHPKADC